ncbi:MAG: chemotaxis protein CheY [Rhodobacter sp. CACIA14H1]|nr:MAG: chemotaxis protein CheY [Rhodobacter sp. CACIA14H1]
MASHVLLIEDEPNIAEAIRFLLGREGLTVSSMSDGTGAAEAVRAQKPDLVILDLMLPGCSGLDVVEAIRANPETGGTPVLMLTAKGAGRDREAAERAGVDRFMTKPFSNADMLAQVRELVGR